MHLSAEALELVDSMKHQIRRLAINQVHANPENQSSGLLWKSQMLPTLNYTLNSNRRGKK